MPTAAVQRSVAERAMVLLTLACPVFLLHGRGLAEALIDLVAALFLWRSWVARDWGWRHLGWMRCALVWWGWLVVCSVPFGPLGIGGWSGFLQATAVLRLPLFVAALQHCVLIQPAPRRWLRWLLATACLYLLAQMLLQAVTGTNLFGVPRFPDGTLTGPYDKPRAAAPLSRLLLPVMLVAVAFLLQRAMRVGPGTRRWLLRIGSVLPPLLGVAVMVLAGQRMPLLLTLLGLLVAGLLLPRLRAPLLVVLVSAPVLVAASALLAPAGFHHLVTLFDRQITHFGHSSYGLIYTRALSIAAANPLTGLGFDGFRHGCPMPGYFRDWPPFGPPYGLGGGAAICVQHAHNHYLQALTDAGIVGLVLFCVVVASWLAALARGLMRPAPDGDDGLLRAWRVGLFAAVFIHEWPIASSSAFTNMPLGGWFFLLLGAGLAEPVHPGPGRDRPGSHITAAPPNLKRDRAWPTRRHVPTWCRSRC